MKNQIAKQAILVLITLLGTISIAVAGISRLPPGSKQPTNREMSFDGIWIGSRNVTLIKQLDGYIILQGKDQVSTW